ncbi:hypothetical protein S7711_02311 [Stachybotrys chartarum IBT 7711]|uniref:Protein kinase domain-containing protein n=1 Tax=Stachybotrys chartarum (strain CBS 109288 / IBT 7711) TaxID=1280523 RepID=A0A084B0X1_STACB|nr:hypothetical protein S7711_02311 [Stachybotrys chartarum IBT 7711]
MYCTCNSVCERTVPLSGVSYSRSSIKMALSSSAESSSSSSTPSVVDGLRLELSPFNLESLDDYVSLGNHPVHLGDHLGPRNRYRVIHKLGQGGFGIVWLCQDTAATISPLYVAVKVYVASESLEDQVELQLASFKDVSKDSQAAISVPLNHFQVEGPNGTHVCLVLPVLGPQMSRELHQESENIGRVLREVCRAVVETVKSLHQHNICHGVQDLDGRDEEEMIRILGVPKRNAVLDGSSPGHSDPRAPQYLVYPVNWAKVPPQYIGEKPWVIDFGQSFDLKAPREWLGLPDPYRAPELFLTNSVGVGVDLWALGCTLFEIRNGLELLPAFNGDPDVHLLRMVRVLGRFPEPWWSTTWENRRIFWSDEEDPSASNQHKQAKNNNSSDCGERGAGEEEPGSLMDRLRPRFTYAVYPGESRSQVIPRDEQELLADLLRRLLSYDPSRRMAAAEALEHEWFKL